MNVMFRRRLVSMLVSLSLVLSLLTVYGQAPLSELLTKKEQSALSELKEQIQIRGYDEALFMRFSDKALPEFRAYETYVAWQETLYDNYPNPDFVANLALESGMSKQNSKRFGLLFASKDTQEQQRLTRNIVTSEGIDYARTVVSSSVLMMHSLDIETALIENWFAKEMNGKIEVKIRSSINTTDINHDDQIYASKQSDETEIVYVGEEETEDGFVFVYEEVPAGSDDDSSNQDEPEDDQDGPTPEGRSLGEFIRDLGWNMFMGAAAGATLGTLAGPSGPATGAALGAIAGALYTFTGGVMLELGEDGVPKEPNPCDHPFIHC